MASVQQPVSVAETKAEGRQRELKGSVPMRECSGPQPSKVQIDSRGFQGCSLGQSREAARCGASLPRVKVAFKELGMGSKAKSRHPLSLHD